MTILIDRSALISFQSCPRQRYLSRHVYGKGLQPRAKALPLAFGGAFHEGSADLLTGRGIEAAVLKSQLFLSLAFSPTGEGIEFGEQTEDEKRAREYGMEEQGALAEALLRAWWAYEGEQFLNQYEVVEVEQEGRATLNHGAQYHLIKSDPANEAQRAEGVESVDYYRQVGSGPELVLMFRPDALVKDRMSGDYYVVSWKTCASFTKRTMDQARHDMQSISEVWGLEQSRGIEKIEGVLYKWIVKGRRSKDDWDGLWKQNSHLVYGWKKVGPAAEGDDWSWTYSWTDPNEINPKTGRAVGHKLGKGWQKVPIWREYPGGVRQWIEDLAANRIAPRHVNALEEVFPQSMPVERRADEVEHWKVQTIAQEIDIAHKVELQLSAARLPEGQTGFENFGDLLDMNFPQFTHSCHSYGSGCPFLPVCFEGASPEPGELYQLRTPNHPEKIDIDE
jgi:hypothetical protein